MPKNEERPLKEENPANTKTTGHPDNVDVPPDHAHFLGFQVGSSSTKLQGLWQRWTVLEKWNELAIRPTYHDCHPDDRFLLSSSVDDLEALQTQIEHIRALFNEQLSAIPIETTPWESDLKVRPSQIPNAGMGLYYIPAAESCDGSEIETTIPQGSLLCYYTGHLHTHRSSRNLQDKSYLMWIRGNTLVDPRPLPNILARYINDPLNDALVNCRYVPTMLLSNSRSGNSPHNDTLRTSVVTTRRIRSGEELFISYGDAYWNHQPIEGNRLVLQKEDNSGKDSICNNSNNGIEVKSSISDDDSDDDADLMLFPFSAKFYASLPTVPISEEVDEN